MTATPDSKLRPNPSRRPAPRFVLGVLLVCLILFTVYSFRGTWATNAPIDPQQPADGVICQLVSSPDGDQIRTAVVIAVPVETAWQILSNYDEWERLFKTVRRKQIAEPVGENQHHVVSEVMTPLGTLSLDFIITHEQIPGGGHLARWDAPTDELPINRGTIRVTPVSPDETLFVYTVRKQYRKYPSFLVNNMLLNYQPDLVSTLADRMMEVAREP